jgi:hypothetical protein
MVHRILSLLHRNTVECFYEHTTVSFRSRLSAYVHARDQLLASALLGHGPVGSRDKRVIMNVSDICSFPSANLLGIWAGSQAGAADLSVVGTVAGDGVLLFGRKTKVRRLHIVCEICALLSTTHRTWVGLKLCAGGMAIQSEPRLQPVHVKLLHSERTTSDATSGLLGTCLMHRDMLDGARSDLA